MSLLTGCDGEESCDENVKKDEVTQQKFDEVEPLDQINNKKRKPETKAKKARKMKTEAISLEEKQMSILNGIDSELKEDEDNKLKDKEYLYGQAISADIRNFGEVDRCMIKHEINNIIFKYQMNKDASSSSANNPLMQMYTCAWSSSANNPLMQMCGLISGEAPSRSSSVASNEFAWPSINSRNLFSPQQSFTSPRAATSTYYDYQTRQ